ncbi:hypothetical protein Sm713_54390 [Streptomyces sp. TS71-3]|nr:hypothetical protein Sm713_54390 [Streptomyces sp. TS71-3]
MEASAQKVARRLEGLRLALTLAGSHLSNQLLESWSMDEYDRKLTEDSTALFDKGAAGGQSRHLVSRTWQLPLDALTEQGLPEATTLLRLMSFWAADPVPMSLFLSVAPGELDFGSLDLAADRVESALRGLLDHSLVGTVKTEGRRYVNAHGVLLDSVAAGVPERDRPALVEAALRLQRTALPPEESVSLPESRAQLRLLAPHSVSLLRRAQREETTGLGGTGRTAGVQPGRPRSGGFDHVRICGSGGGAPGGGRTPADSERTARNGVSTGPHGALRRVRERVQDRAEAAPSRRMSSPTTSAFWAPSTR